MPFVVQNNRINHRKQESQKMKKLENFVTSVPFVVKKRTPSPATPLESKTS
jgi:hypothetical protein